MGRPYIFGFDVQFPASAGTSGGRQRHFLAEVPNLPLIVRGVDLQLYRVDTPAPVTVDCSWCLMCNSDEIISGVHSIPGSPERNPKTIFTREIFGNGNFGVYRRTLGTAYAAAPGSSFFLERLLFSALPAGAVIEIRGALECEVA